MFLWSSVNDLYQFLGRPAIDDGTAEVNTVSYNEVPADEDADFEKIEEKVDDEQEKDEMQYIFNRLVDDAIISWFVDEICNEEYRQQSDNDYEAGLNDRVEEFLRLTSDEIIRRHFDRNMRKAELNTIIQNQGNRTQKIKKCLEYLRVDDPCDLADMISRRCSFRKKAFKAALKEDADEETERDIIAEVERELRTERELEKDAEPETRSNNENMSENNTDETVRHEEICKNEEKYRKREDPLRKFPYLLNGDFIKLRGQIESEKSSENVNPSIDRETSGDELDEAETVIRESNSGRVIRYRNVGIQTNKISRLWTKIFDGAFGVQDLHKRGFHM